MHGRERGISQTTLSDNRQIQNVGHSLEQPTQIFHQDQWQEQKKRLGETDLNQGVLKGE